MEDWLLLDMQAQSNQAINKRQCGYVNAIAETKKWFWQVDYSQGTRLLVGVITRNRWAD